MPAFNEGGGIRSFLAEIAECLDGVADRVEVIVVDDQSTDDTARVVGELALEFPLPLRVVLRESNSGHGPTALAAWRSGLATGASVVLHVDGDGQFLGPDLRRAVLALSTRPELDGVHGVRRARTDPWFRKVLTAAVAAFVALTTGSRVPDVNTPLRVYRADAIRRLVEAVPADALVPHVHFSLLERRLGLRIGHVEVTSIARRGDSENGTMWGAGERKPVLPPARLRRFVVSAAREVLAQRRAGGERT